MESNENKTLKNEDWHERGESITLQSKNDQQVTKAVKPAQFAIRANETLHTKCLP